MAPRRLRHTAVLGSRLLGHAHRTPSGEARNSAGTCGTSRCEPMGGLAWRERAAVDDTRGGIAQRHCPVPGAGVVEGPVPGPGLARAPCRRRVRRPDQVPHRGGRLPRETPSGRARGAGVEFFRAMWSSLGDMRAQADRLLSKFPLEVVSRLSPAAELQGNGLWGERPPGVLVP